MEVTMTFLKFVQNKGRKGVNLVNRRLWKKLISRDSTVTEKSPWMNPEANPYYHLYYA